VKCWYDREGDVLELLFADEAGVLEEIADDVFTRHTSDGRVIGLAVFNFSKHNKDTLNLPLAVAVKAA
jgi:uncharacterized protein YuzE